jgi:protein TonB
MTNKEILQADLLDILFEHRNKLYGAYALRKTYTHRLGFALGVSLSLVLLFVFMSFIKNDNRSNGPFKDDRTMILSDVAIPKEEIKEPERQRQEPKPQIAQADHQQIIVVPDKDADVIPDQQTISESEVSNVNADGNKPDGFAKPITETNGNGDIPLKEPEENNNPVLPGRPPTFPGGTAAWLAFLQKFLQAPEDLDPGQRIEVLVKFWVGVDGSVTNPEIIKSGGKSFDKEVLRVMKKMPRWEPAIQNRNYVSVAYTQPVIFIGVED